MTSELDKCTHTRPKACHVLLIYNQNDYGNTEVGGEGSGVRIGREDVGTAITDEPEICTGD